ncbi:DUF6366 family protein [Fictibacillus iocasae]|uniref:DUF6366 family protein n=1 Tax=Fictibacillus iocasae TaxID=2715437 RepID=A0ABW2NRB5_9BACL
MVENKETPEQKRERLRQEESKRNPTGNMNDALNRAQAGNLTDAAGGLGWSGFGLLILIIVISFVIGSYYFE